MINKFIFITVSFFLAFIIQSVILKLYSGYFFNYETFELIIHFVSLKLIVVFVFSLIISFFVLYFFRNKFFYFAVAVIFLILSFPLFKTFYYIANLKEVDKIQKYFFKCDKKHVIAHAAGEIDGKVYTDSLDALNVSYKKGFKFFELDIRKTKDGKFVAVHDWNKWKKMTGFKGDIPTLKEFLSLKIYHKYTPLDLKRINEWFKIHKDAVLITDKINNPEFANLFVDKKRIMMELFSLDSFIESKKMHIIGMPNWGVIKYIDYKKLPGFIKYMTISSGSYYQELKKMKFLSTHGVKIYVFGDYDKKIKPYYYYGRYVDNLKFCKDKN